VIVWGGQNILPAPIITLKNVCGNIIIFMVGLSYDEKYFGEG